MPSQASHKTFLDVPAESLLEFLKTHGQGAFRAKQIYEWFFNRGAGTFQEMSDLPAPLRTALEEQYRLHPLRIRRKEESKLDGTIRYFFEAHDHETVATVFLPESDRLSLCLSTQVGCAYKCQFCASGLVPFKRQLSAAEIIDQILAYQKRFRSAAEGAISSSWAWESRWPNYAQVTQSIRWITSSVGLGMSPSRVTLSTSGLIPQNIKLADDQVKVKLAVSLCMRFMMMFA